MESKFKMKQKTLLFFLSIICCLSTSAQSTIDVDGGKIDKSVSRFTKKIDGQTIVSAKVVFSSKIPISLTIKERSALPEELTEEKLINGMNQYTVVFYLTESTISKTITIAAEGYENFSLPIIALNPKETYKYYVFDPQQEKRATRIIKKRQTSHYLKVANMALSNNEYKKAQEGFDKAIALDIMCDSAYYGKGRIFIEQKKYSDALMNYQMALNINPDFLEIYDDFRELSLYELATKSKLTTKRYYNDYKEIDPLLTNNWILLGSMSNPYFAEDCYINALKEDSENLEAYYMLGHIRLTFIGEVTKGKESFKQLISLSDIYCKEIADVINSKYRNTYDKKVAKQYFIAGVKLFEYATTKYPQNFDCNYNLAHFYNSTGKIKESIEFYDRAVDIAEHQNETIDPISLGDCYYDYAELSKDKKRVAKKLYTHSINAYEKVLGTEQGLKSWGYSLYYKIGMIYERLEDTENAIINYQKSYDNGNRLSSRRALSRLKK